MLARHRGTTFMIVLLAAGLCGCDGTDQVTQATYDPQDVQAATEAAAVAGPAAGMTQEIVVGLLQGALGGPAAMAAGGDSLVPVHETSVYLASGIAGTCSLDSLGGVDCEFGGTATVNGHVIEVTGGLSAKPSAGQPSIGTTYDIDFHASAGSAHGSATWTCLGDLTLGLDGLPVDHDFTMTHTVTPTGGATVVVAATDSPSRFELVVTGPLGGTVRFNLDRQTMSGSVYVNARLVATVTIEGSCTDVDFVDERHDDITICPQG